MVNINIYRDWVSLNIKSAKVAGEFNNAINWMENNINEIRIYLDDAIEHPALQFTSVMDKLIGRIKDDVDSRKLILNWLVEDNKVPFGKIIKTKILRKLRKYYIRLEQSEIQQLEILYTKMSMLEFKPSEYKWLERIHDRKRD